MNQNDTQPTQKPVVKSALIKEEPTTTQSEPVAESTQPEQQVAARVAEPPVASPPPAQPQGDYGERPDKPGFYAVFNKLAVIQAAGIPVEHQTTAVALISQINMDWNYYNPTDKRYNLCTISPVEKMAIAGEDYRTNPVTQMKWCANYVIKRYGSWEAALQHASVVHSI